MFPYFCVSVLFKSLIKIKAQSESRLHYIDIIAYHRICIIYIHLISFLSSAAYIHSYFLENRWFEKEKHRYLRQDCFIQRWIRNVSLKLDGNLKLRRRHSCLILCKVLMEGKLFQRCTHFLYCSVLSLDGKVNTRRMSQPDMESIFTKIIYEIFWS